jgi:YesN/AraC family two-component response regulator
VLTDIRMPTMNGFDLYQKIREIDENIKVPFLTASEINYDEFGDKVAPTIDDTKNCFIRKPVENQKLLNAINEIMK